MGQLGRYIDSLTPEQKDRVIEAPEFWWSGSGDLNALGRALRDGRGCGCLIDTAEGEDQAWTKYKYKEFTWQQWLGCTFDVLCERFGGDRITRVVKARAAKPPISQLLTPAAPSSIVQDNLITTAGGV